MSLYYFRPLLDEIQLPLLTRFQNLSLQLKPNERVSAEVVDMMPSGAALLRIKGSEIEVKTQIPLQKGMQLDLQVLPPQEGKKELLLQIVSIKTLQQKEIANLLKGSPAEDLLLKLSIGNKEEVRNYMMEKGSLPYQKLFAQGILDKKAIIASIQEGLDLLPFALSMKRAQQSVTALVERSGLFTLQKLQAIVKKGEAIVQELHEDPKIARELLQQFLQDPKKAPKELQTKMVEFKAELSKIEQELTPSPLYDYSRLMSFLSEAFFVPFFWELGEGALYVREVKKGGYLCRIYLDLEGIGSVEIDLFAQGGDLLVDFYMEHEAFKRWLLAQSDALKEMLPFNEVFLRFHTQRVDEKSFIQKALRDHIVDVKT